MHASGYFIKRSPNPELTAKMLRHYKICQPGFDKMNTGVWDQMYMVMFSVVGHKGLERYIKGDFSEVDVRAITIPLFMLVLEHEGII